MQQCKSTLAVSRFFGVLSAILFCIAATMVFDGLQAIMRQDLNQINIIAGEKMTFTGSMPRGKTALEDVVVTVDPPSYISLRVYETFSGFWFGGTLWRAEASVPEGTPQGTITLTIQDIWTDTDKNGVTTSRQNPALIYPLHIWKDQQAQDSVSHSVVTRLSGFPPFVLCAVALAGAVLLGLLQWLFARKGLAQLAMRGFTLVHGTKQTDTANLALFNPAKGAGVALEGSVTLYDRRFAPMGTGTVVEMNEHSAVAAFARALRPRYGYFLSVKPPDSTLL